MTTDAKENKMTKNLLLANSIHLLVFNIYEVVAYWSIDTSKLDEFWGFFISASDFVFKPFYDSKELFEETYEDIFEWFLYFYKLSWFMKESLLFTEVIIYLELSDVSGN